MVVLIGLIFQKFLRMDGFCRYLILKMFKIFIFSFLSLPFSLALLVGQDGTKLDRFEEIYSRWATDHQEYECEMKPELDIVNSKLHLWQIKKDSGELDSVFRINSDTPISYEAYIFITDEGDQVMNFPETHRTILLYPKREMGLNLREIFAGASDSSTKWSLMKPFLIFEKLNEGGNSTIFEMILDVKKMEDAGVISVGSNVHELRIIASLEGDGMISKVSRQFDDDEVETLSFEYISYSSKEVRDSFPCIEDRSSGSITPDWSIKDAIDEIISSRGATVNYFIDK